MQKRRRRSCSDPKLDVFPLDVLSITSHADNHCQGLTAASLMLQSTTMNIFDMARGWWHIGSCDSACPVRKVYVLTFPCLRVLQLYLQQHQAWTIAGSLLLFLLHSHVELPPEGKCSHHLLPPFQTKPRGSQRHFMPVLHFRLPCCCVFSLQPIYLFCLWPFSRFPWCLCSLKSSAVCSATCSIVNTSKTVQTVG